MKKTFVTQKNAIKTISMKWPKNQGKLLNIKRKRKRILLSNVLTLVYDKWP